MICDKCGYDETESITICQKCGTELVTEDNQSAPSKVKEKKEKKKKASKSKSDKSKLSKNLIYIIISAVSIFIIAGTVIFILQMGKNDGSSPADLFAPPATPDMSSMPPGAMPGGPDDFPGGFPGDTPGDGPVGGPGGPPGPPGNTPRPQGPVDADEAREIAQEWIDGILFWADVSLASGERTETIDGRDFYRFDPVNLPVDQFGILVHKLTGHLYHLPIEGGGSAGPLGIEALDTWFNKAFGTGTPSADIYAAIGRQGERIDINIYMFGGEHISFIRDTGGKWSKHDSDGREDVELEIKKEDGFLTIRIPPAPVSYQLNDGFEGEYNDEQLRWSYSIG